MNNNKNKIRATFTIDPDLFDTFVSLSDSNGVSRSKVVSLFIKKWIEENNSTNNLKNDKG
jgi:hypothetical protein